MYPAAMYSAAEVIRAARRLGGLTQQDLAAAAGVSQPNVAAYERGTRVPSLAMLERLTDACRLQLRMELEPRWADVDRDVRHLLGADEFERMSGDGYFAFLAATRLATVGAPIVLDGHLAARALGAPVRPARTYATCPAGAAGELAEAARRIHHTPQPLPGTATAIGDLEVRFVDPQPTPVWVIGESGLAVVGVDHLIGQDGWSGPDRLALERLSLILAERGPVAHGLPAWPGPDPSAGSAPPEDRP